MFVPLVLAGGSGTRLWPLSRELYPKQFHELTSDVTMLQQTVLRMDGLNAAEPVVICNEEHRFLAGEQLRQIGHGDARIILEPDGRSTAPAVAVAARYLMDGGDDPVMLVLAADHLIRDVKSFHAAIAKALPLAEAGRLVTFGIVPTAPETGYGYIRRGGAVGEGLAVDGFEEKPDRATAEGFVASGDYFWNSGMFMFKAARYLAELDEHSHEIAVACEKAAGDFHPDLQFLRMNEAAFRACPSQSIDHAVMEHTENAVVVPLEAGWSDVGSWSALWEVQERDKSGNAFAGDVLATGTTNTLARAESRLVALVGIDNAIVVETKDAVLVADSRKVQDIKDVVERLKANGRKELVSHRQVYRPWGSYDSLDFGTRDQVKRIIVNPGAKLSVQMHHHRAEHWVVVRGTARVQRGDENLLLSENQSIYIPVGTIHSLENPGKIALELIEVQTGSYLGEDDIVRFEDRYGRSR